MKALIPMKVEKYESKYVTGLSWPWASCLVWDTCERSKVDSSKRSDGDLPASESQKSEEMISINLSLLASFCMRLRRVSK